MIDWRAYRVIAVTDERDKNSPISTSNDNFVLCVSAPSYCTPGISFWLSEHMECPKSECVLLEFPEDPVSDQLMIVWGKKTNQMPKGVGLTTTKRIEFEWDGGRYVGTFEERTDRPDLNWANGQICDATVYNISSL